MRAISSTAHMGLVHRFLSSGEMEHKGGIKAQHAVFAALKGMLPDWKVRETETGSNRDRQGVDILLRKGGQLIELDVSFREKEGRNTLNIRDWMFNVPANGGAWSFRREYLPILRRRLEDVIRAAETGRLTRTA